MTIGSERLSARQGTQRSFGTFASRVPRRPAGSHADAGAWSRSIGSTTSRRCWTKTRGSGAASNARPPSVDFWSCSSISRGFDSMSNACQSSAAVGLKVKYWAPRVRGPGRFALPSSVWRFTKKSERASVPVSSPTSSNGTPQWAHGLREIEPQGGVIFVPRSASTPFTTSTLSRTAPLMGSVRGWS
jgi:hypothetical protein